MNKFYIVAQVIALSPVVQSP